MYTQYSTSVSFVKYYLHKNEHEILFKINELAPLKTVTISKGYSVRHTTHATAQLTSARYKKYTPSITIPEVLPTVVQTPALAWC